jgi:hypothetical protein
MTSCWPPTTGIESAETAAPAWSREPFLPLILPQWQEATNEHRSSLWGDNG